MMLRSLSCLRRGFLAVVAIVLVAPTVPAQRVAPPPSESYEATLHYRIRAARNERIPQFFAMTRYLESLGFRRVPGDADEPADPTAERMTGTLPSKSVREVFREPHVQTLLLVPSGATLPDDSAARVLVDITIAALYTPSRQEPLWEQTAERLALLGFVPKVGYDHRGFTRLLGTVPVGELFILLNDLRFEPSGWVAPATAPDELPEPLRGVSPLKIIEVAIDPPGIAAAKDVPPPAEPPAGQEFLGKLSADLRNLLAKEDAARTTMRIEIVLGVTPPRRDETYRGWLPPLAVEGRIGPVVTVLATPTVAAGLAALPVVESLRLPRPATAQPLPPADRPADVLAATRLDRLHQLGGRGAGIKLAVIDADFSGYEQHLGKGLPAKTRLLDLTAERNPNLLPDPPATADFVGHGTRAALAAALAAPDAELILVRIDPAAVHQLYTVARHVHGEAFRTESLGNRDRELLDENDRLDVARLRITEERRQLLENFTTDEATEQRRLDLDARIRKLAREDEEQRQKLIRFNDLEMGLADLANVRVAACPLAWNEGYPTDGAGVLSRYLDDVFFGRPPIRYALGRRLEATEPAVWFQAAGDTRGQTWAGRFHDADHNGVLEFLPLGGPLPSNRWTPELNFLAWKSKTGDEVIDLPAGAKVRLALQWTEAHDPDLAGVGVYREPLAALRLLILRQRDPSGTKVATDDLDVAARSVRLPQLLARHPAAATYEQVVEFMAEAGGRFAVRVEGRFPATIRPPTAPTVPAQVRFWEPSVRLFLDAADPATRGQGRPVFLDSAPDRGGLGTPGDAALVSTVGAAARNGMSQSYSASGAPMGQELLAKPRFLMFDESPLPGGAARGTRQSTAFAAGLLASVLSKGGPPSRDLRWLDVPPGGVLRVPEPWLGQIERR